MFEFISARYNAKEITAGIIEGLEEKGLKQGWDQGRDFLSQTLQEALPYMYLGGTVAIATPILLGYLYYTHKPSLADSTLPVEIIPYSPLFSFRKTLPAPIYNPETTKEAALVVDRLKSQAGVPLPKIALEGPSGSGKEALAKQMAKDASMNFVSVSGEDLNPSNYAEIEKLIRYSKKRRTLVYIDQAGLIPNLESVLNRLEVASQNLAITYGTEKALKGSRTDFKIQLNLPGSEETKQILSSYIDFYFSDEVKVEYFDVKQLGQVASQIKGFSARQIKQLTMSLSSFDRLSETSIQEITRKQVKLNIGKTCYFF